MRRATFSGLSSYRGCGESWGIMFCILSLRGDKIVMGTEKGSFYLKAVCLIFHSIMYEFKHIVTIYQAKQHILIIAYKLLIVYKNSHNSNPTPQKSF